MKKFSIILLLSVFLGLCLNSAFAGSKKTTPTATTVVKTTTATTATTTLLTTSTSKPQSTKFCWKKLPGCAKEISVGADGSVFVTGCKANKQKNYEIYQWNPTSKKWKDFGAQALKISVDKAGNPWTVNSKGNILRWSGKGWNQIPGCARDIGVGSDGSVFIIGCDAQAGGYGVWKYDSASNKFTEAPKIGGVQITVDPYGNPFIANSKRAIYKLEPTTHTWKLETGCAVDIAVGGEEWIIGCKGGYSGGNQILQYIRKTDQWIVNKGSASKIAVGAKGEPWVINKKGYIYQGRRC